jgi:acetyl esterase/lipase
MRRCISLALCWLLILSGTAFAQDRQNSNAEREAQAREAEAREAQARQEAAQKAQAEDAQKREAQARQNAARRNEARPNRNVNVSTDIEYGKAGERNLTLNLYKPVKPSGETLPVIVWIHGGGWRNGDKSSGSRLNEFVATGNYVGVSVGYRLSGEAVWPAQIHDCKAAVRWVRANAKEHGIDPERIGLWGSSAGGHLVSLLGTSSDVEELDGSNGTPGVSSRVKCVVDYCGPSQMTIFKHQAATLLFGTEENHKAQSEIASPATHVTKDDPAFLIVHGTDDGTVPFSQAELFYDKLKAAGVDVTFIKMEGGGHGIGGPEITARVKNFFDKHLRDKDVKISDEPIAVKAAQN